MLHGSLETVSNIIKYRYMAVWKCDFQTNSHLQTAMQRSVVAWRPSPKFFLLLHGSLETVSKLSRIRCMAVWRQIAKLSRKVAMVVWRCLQSTMQRILWQFGDHLPSTTDTLHGSLETFSNLPRIVSWQFKVGLQTATDQLHGSLEQVSKLGSVAWQFGVGLQSTMDPLHGSLEKLSNLPRIRCMVDWRRSLNCHATDLWQFGDVNLLIYL